MNKPRLIDANEWIKELRSNTGANVLDRFVNERIIGLLEKRPTAYNLDDVVEQLEREEHRAVVNYHNSRGFKVTEAYGQRVAFERAIEIVKGGAE